MNSNDSAFDLDERLDDAGLWPVTSPPSPTLVFDRSFAGDREMLHDSESMQAFVTPADRSTRLWVRSVQEPWPGRTRYLVVPLRDPDIVRLKSDVGFVCRALDTMWLWVVDVDVDGHVVGAWVIPGLKSIPERYRPSASSALEGSELAPEA